MDSTGRTTIFPQGETIYRIGDGGNQMFVVLRGGVELHGDGGSVELVQSGGVFGELAVIEGGPRNDRAVALVETEVIPIDTKRFLTIVQTTPSFALQMMRAVAARARKNSDHKHDHNRDHGMVA